MKNPIPHSKPWVTAQEAAAVWEVVREGRLTTGEAVAEFKGLLCRTIAVPSVYLTPTGTFALFLALKSLGLRQGDEIILPTYVCKSVLQSVVLVGAKPVLCDIGPNWNMTVETVSPHISSRTRAIIVVHLFGIAEPVAAFRAFGVPLISDLCQAFDAGLLRNGVAEDRGDIIVLSFHATKCLTTGRGGAASAVNPGFEATLAGVAQEYADFIPMTDTQAALGVVQLTRYTDFQRRRRELAEYYLKNLPTEPCQALLSIAARWSFYRFPLRLTIGSFDCLANELLAEGIVVRRGVDAMLHRFLDLADAAFPNAVLCFDETLSLPLYAALSDDEAGHVVRAFNRVWRRHRHAG